MMDANQVQKAIMETGWNRLLKIDAANHTYHLWNAMLEYSINTPDRASAFLAQIAHETGGWRWLCELGGPSYFQRYDGRKDLGNTEPFDGYLYRGRGYIHLTGRANYRLFARLLELPLEEQPELAKSPPIAARIAGLFWDKHHLNSLADRGEFKEITKVINGGYNGLADRIEKYNKIRKIFYE